MCPHQVGEILNSERSTSIASIACLVRAMILYRFVLCQVQIRYFRSHRLLIIMTCKNFRFAAVHVGTSAMLVQLEAVMLSKQLAFQGIADAQDLRALFVGCTSGTAGTHTCDSCGAGKFSRRNNDVLPLKCNPCPSGHYQEASGQDTCVACAQGTYVTNLGSSFCLVCEKGYYQGAEGQNTCMNCEQGKYSDTTGASSCLACPTGQIQALTGSSSCTACGPGTYSDENATECLLCPTTTTAVPTTTPTPTTTLTPSTTVLRSTAVSSTTTVSSTAVSSTTAVRTTAVSSTTAVTPPPCLPVPLANQPQESMLLNQTHEHMPQTVVTTNTTKEIDDKSTFAQTTQLGYFLGLGFIAFTGLAAGHLHRPPC